MLLGTSPQQVGCNNFRWKFFNYMYMLVHSLIHVIKISFLIFKECTLNVTVYYCKNNLNYFLIKSRLWILYINFSIISHGGHGDHCKLDDNNIQCRNRRWLTSVHSPDSLHQRKKLHKTLNENISFKESLFDYTPLLCWS